MRECQDPEFRRLYADVSRLSSRLQPLWFKPLFRAGSVRRNLGFDHWSRRWEYPWALLTARLAPGMRVLDVGSGASPFPMHLGSAGVESYAADPALDQGRPKNSWRRRVAWALGIATSWGSPPRRSHRHTSSLRVRYYPDSIQQLSFQSEFFDRVFCLSVVEHIPQAEWSVCMQQLARVVKRGGLLLLTLDMSTPAADARLYQSLLEACPLDLIGDPTYPVPISREDKELRHPGYTYETIGLAWQKA